MIRGVRTDGEVLWGLDAQELVILCAGLAIVLLIVPAVFGSGRNRAGRAVRDILGWSAIAFVVMAGYNYRDELGQIAFRIAGEFAPPGTADGQRTRTARAARGAHAPAWRWPLYRAGVRQRRERHDARRYRRIDCGAEAS